MQINDILLLSLKTLKPWKLYCLYRFFEYHVLFFYHWQHSQCRYRWTQKIKPLKDTHNTLYDQCLSGFSHFSLYFRSLENRLHYIVKSYYCFLQQARHFKPAFCNELLLTSETKMFFHEVNLTWLRSGYMHERMYFSFSFLNRTPTCVSIVLHVALSFFWQL